MPAPEATPWPEELSSFAQIATDAGRPEVVRCQALRSLSAAIEEEQPEEVRNRVLSLLATVASDERSPREVRETAFNGIRPAIRKSAEIVAVKFTRQLRDDLLEEAETIIWERLPKFRDGQGRFESWCHTVLKRRTLDWIRRSKADPAAQAIRMGGAETDDSAEPEEADFRPLLEAALDAETAFSEPDLKRIQEWKPWDRVVLLCLSGLSAKVPPERWAAWLSECHLAPPFPPSEVAATEVHRRTAVFAAALGMKPNTVAQTWSRGRHLLRKLEYLRGLQP